MSTGYKIQGRVYDLFYSSLTIQSTLSLRPLAVASCCPVTGLCSVWPSLSLTEFLTFCTRFLTLFASFFTSVFAFLFPLSHQYSFFCCSSLSINLIPFTTTTHTHIPLEQHRPTVQPTLTISSTQPPRARPFLLCSS